MVVVTYSNLFCGAKGLNIFLTTGRELGLLSSGGGVVVLKYEVRGEFCNGLSLELIKNDLLKTNLFI